MPKLNQTHIIDVFSQARAADEPVKDINLQKQSLFNIDTNNQFDPLSNNVTKNNVKIL